MTTETDNAYVIHTRSYRETSQLVTLFSAAHGRFNLVAKGARRGKSAAGASKLQPFIPLLVSWRGRGELKTLTGVEPCGRIHILQGRQLYIGLYINELLSRLLHEHDPHQQLYRRYGELLETVALETNVEPALREFEFFLLEELGYGLQLDVDIRTGEAVEAGESYVFLPGEGVTRAAADTEEKQLISGSVLQSLAAGDYGEGEVRQVAKWLARRALQPYLGDRPLQSRLLFK